MKNCLVEKLKAVVNNDELPKLNTIRIKISNSEISNKNFVTVTFIGNLSTSPNTAKLYHTYQNAVDDVDGFTELPSQTSTRTNSCYLSVGEYYIEISPKDIYRLSVNYQTTATINFGGLNDFEYVSTLENLSVAGARIEGDISKINKNVNMNTLVLQGCSDVNGNISKINTLTLLQSINLANTQVSGSLEALGGLTKLTSLVLTDCGVSGDLATMASAMVTSPNSRTSGTLTVTCNNVVKLNGTVIPRRGTVTIKFGTSMESPTAEDTARGWQSTVS